MDITHLRYILAIEECGTINKAAHTLYVSQPHLSTSLKTVEDALGISIFKRTQRGVEVTDEGREFLTSARHIVFQFDAMQKKYDQHKHDSLDLRVACVRSSLFTYPMPQLLDKYRSQKNLRISIVEAGILRVVELVKSGRSDVGFLMHASSNRNIYMNLIKSNNLSYTSLGAFNLLLLMRGSDPLAKKETLTLEDVKDYTYIAYEEFEESSLFLTNEHKFMNHVLPSKVVYVNDRNTLFTFLTREQTYTTSHRIPRQLAKRYGLVSKPCRLTDLTSELGYICREDYTLSPYVEALVHQIQKSAELLDRGEL